MIDVRTTVSTSARRPNAGGCKLLCMIARRRIASLLILAFAGIAGCKERQNAPAPDTSMATPSPRAVIPASSVNPGWDSAAGSVLLLPVSNMPYSVSVVLPALTDSAMASAKSFDIGKLSGIEVDLFGKAGKVGSGSLVAQSQHSVVEGCLSWPTGQLSGATATNWWIALEKGRVVGIPLDSLEGLASADSAEMAKQIVLAATSLPAASDSVFRGIPFAIRRAYRFMLGRSVVILSDVVRKINEEANPREEHLVLIVEHPSGGSYHVAYQSRSSGPEESLVTVEALAAVRFIQRNQPAIFISSEYEDGGQVGLIERKGEAQWRTVWRSAYTGC